MLVQNALLPLNIGGLLQKGHALKGYLHAHWVSSEVFTCGVICLGFAWIFHTRPARLKNSGLSIPMLNAEIRLAKTNEKIRLACGGVFLSLSPVIRFANQIPPLRRVIELLPTNVRSWIS